MSQQEYCKKHLKELVRQVVGAKANSPINDQQLNRWQDDCEGQLLDIFHQIVWSKTVQLIRFLAKEHRSLILESQYSVEVVVHELADEPKEDSTSDVLQVGLRCASALPVQRKNQDGKEQCVTHFRFDCLWLSHKEYTVAPAQES